MRYRWTPLLLFPLATACVTSPYNGTEIGSKATVVTFSGYAISPSASVVVQASLSGNGGWNDIANTTSSANATTVWDGTKLYAFSVQASVPANRWSQASCTEDQTFIRIQAGGFLLPTFDDPSISGVEPSVCMTDQQSGGAGFFDALLACQSPESPVARILEPEDHTVAHVGNLVIDDPGDLQAWGCVESVDGNLTIGGSWTFDVSLPVLTSVSGELTVDYPREPNTAFPVVRSPEVPQLATVGTDLTLTSAHPGGVSQVISIPFGMPSLTDVGGDIDVSIDTFNVSGSGFSSFTHHTGNLSIVTGNGDTAGFFTFLQTVDGDVFLDIGHTLAGVLPNLQTVGGDFALVDGNPNQFGFQDLVSVGGDFTLGDIQLNGPANSTFFSSLASVGGTIALSGTQIDELALGAGPIEAAALTLDSNLTLQNLGPGDLQVIGPGTITITNNPDLCLSGINAFLNGQNNWTGASVIGGNDDGC